MTPRHAQSGGVAVYRLITGAGGLVALVEVGYIALVALHVSPASGVYRAISALAQPLALMFPGLFAIQNVALSVVVNYGLAAVFWLLATGILARLLVA